MTRSEREELRRAIVRFQELTQPHRLLTLLESYDRLERETSAKEPLDVQGYTARGAIAGMIEKEKVKL